MREQLDDSNYEGMISRLAKGSLEEKAQSLRKLLFLYENARSRIYLYERRIAESMQLCLLIEERDISLNALNLLERMLTNTSSQSEILTIIKKRLLSKIVLNLGSAEITIRKVSHKCVLEYVKKFHDFDPIVAIYLRTALLQTDNSHLKVKAINSLHSLLMAEHKYYSHDQSSSKPLLEQLIHASHQTQHGDIRRAALLCLIFLLKIKNIEPQLQSLSPQTQLLLSELRKQSEQLGSILDFIFKVEVSQEQNNAPSPKFLSIQQSQELKQKSQIQVKEDSSQLEVQMKVFNEVSYAEQFLKRLQKTTQWQFQQIQQFAPFLQKCLVDDSIKLFSISKKIVEVIFNSQDGKKKQYYVVLVPCIVNGIGNKRFLVRKNIDKLVRQYIKNHTEVWVHNFIERFSSTKNSKVKQMLIDLLMHAYKTSPEFYFSTERAFEVFDTEISDSNSSLKRKLIDCIVLILQKHGKDQKNRVEMLQVFSSDPYNKIIRKMGKTNPSLGSYSENVEHQTLETVSPVVKNKSRKNRLVTAEPEPIKRQSEENTNPHISGDNEDRHIVKDKKVRNSHIEINFRLRKNERRSKDEKNQRRSKDEKNSQDKLPQLKKIRNTSNSKQEESPVKKQIIEKNIMYVEKEQLKTLQSPRAQLEKVVEKIRDANWTVQFDGINKLRCIVEYHRQIITEQNLAVLVGELVQCLNNIRSGVAKLSLICLNQMMKKFHRRMHPFTQSIVLTVIRKSITTSEFMQEQIKKCIATTTEELCINKLILAINSIKETKSPEIKLTILLFLQYLIRNQRNYKNQCQFLWTLLVQFHQEPQFNLRTECKKLVKMIIQCYKDWKDDVMQMKKPLLQKIEKIMRNIKGDTLWLQVQNQQFQKALLSKVMTSKYFAGSFNRFQEMDKAYLIKRNWKERIKLLNEIFQSAFEHPSEFEANANAKKYVLMACEHVDDKNPGLLINAMNNISRSIDVFPNIVEECLGQLMDKCVAVVDTRRGELVAVGNKILHKVYAAFNANKIIKEYLKVCNAGRTRVEIINQIILVLRDHLGGSDAENTLLNCQSMLAKSIVRLCSDKHFQVFMYAKLRELYFLCQKKFGQQFTQKVLSNDKAVEILT